MSIGREAVPVNATIRPAQPDDGDELRTIERLAGARFRDVGLDSIADDEPPSIDELAAFALAGRSWVAVDVTGLPVGYVLVDVGDDCAHVEQISVRPDHQGAGIGRALLDRVRLWAVSNNYRAITLTTFDDVPWNRPLYEHLGFRVLSESEIGPHLRAVREDEASHGLDVAARVCMRLDLGG
jgi:GNAT superfamily N-acetyltransferase